MGSPVMDLEEFNHNMTTIAEIFCTWFEDEFTPAINAVSDAMIDIFGKVDWPGIQRSLDEIERWAIIWRRDNESFLEWGHRLHTAGLLDDPIIRIEYQHAVWLAIVHSPISIWHKVWRK